MAVTKLLLLLVVAAAVASESVIQKSEPAGFVLLGKTKQTRSNSQTSFHLSSEKNSWEDAFNKCRDELDGKLLTLESSTKENLIKEYLKSYTLDYVWTSGLYDVDSNVWYWLTNEQEVVYNNWKTGVAPNTGSAFRIAFYKALKPNWQSLPKSNLNRFICEVEE